MSTEPETTRRRTLLIDRRFQLRFCALLGTLLVSYFAVLSVVWVIGPRIPAWLGGADAALQEDLQVRWELMMRLALPAILTTFVCIFVHGIVISFRIAGPNHRFKQVFADLGALRIPRAVKIRKKDYLQETAEALDDAVRSLHVAVSELQESGRAVMAELEGNGDRTLEERLHEARVAMEFHDRILRRFQVTSTDGEREDDEGAESGTTSHTIVRSERLSRT